MDEKIVLVTRQTRLEGLIARFNTRPQARFYIERSGGDFAQYEREHESYYEAIRSLRLGLRALATLQPIERDFLPSFLFGPRDVVVTVGIDGLVVNTAKYLDGQPLVAVNPDPAHIDGILLPFSVEQAPAVVRRVLRREMKLRAISMAEARLNDGQTLLAFNDLFLGMHNHVSARYRIQANGREEHQSSSGIIIATGAGSTGWLSSAFNMADGLLAYAGERDATIARPALTWDTEQLIFVVREPFVSKTTGASIVCGPIRGDSPLVVESTMAEGGVIFSDGVAADYLAFNAGAIATIGPAAKKTQLVIG
jgi:hypothetical protein